MKRIITALLTLIVTLSSMNVIFAKQIPEFKAIVVSDLHLTAKSTIPSISNFATMTEYPMYSHVGTNGLMWAESEAILKQFLDLAAECDEKYILISGDLSNGGNAQGHETIRALFEKFEIDTGKQIFVINGNHDCKDGYTKARFEQTYRNFGFAQALARHADSLSYTSELDANYRLLAIDSCEENKSAGAVSESLMKWIAEQASAAKADGKHLVAMMHHNLLRHMDGIGIDIAENYMDDRISNADEVWEKLADLKIKYIFTGHAHANDISSKISESGNEIFDVETDALSAYPCGYRKVSFSDTAVKISTDYVRNIETANLPQGYTDEQLEHIVSDFPLYSKKMLEVSANYMLRSYLLYPEIELDKLHIDVNSELGNLLAELMPEIYYTLCLPLYESDATQHGLSIEKIAANYAYTLPESGYYDVFGVIVEILSAHIMGDENFPADSVEVRLTVDCLKVAALNALNGLELPLDRIIAGSDATLEFTRLKDCVSKTAFREGIVAKALQTFFAPIIEGVSTDVIAPGDINVTLPSYIQKATVQERSVSEWLQELFKDIFSVFIDMFKEIATKDSI